MACHWQQVINIVVLGTPVIDNIIVLISYTFVLVNSRSINLSRSVAAPSLTPATFSFSPTQSEGKCDKYNCTSGPEFPFLKSKASGRCRWKVNPNWTEKKIEKKSTKKYPSPT